MAGPVRSPPVEKKHGQRNRCDNDQTSESEQTDEHEPNGDEDDDELGDRDNPRDRPDAWRCVFPAVAQVQPDRPHGCDDGEPPWHDAREHEDGLNRRDPDGDLDSSATQPARERALAVFHDKTVIMATQKRPFKCFVIKSRDVADSFTAQFEYMWGIARK